ncbi:MAG: hypothetical protein F6K31_06910 [Symploca sp. SIO2G7]|nr:hypothetical protein [Symploca sp. SIO2G7]
MRGIEVVLEFADELVHTTTGKHLNDLQRTILRESWQEAKKTYDQLAQEYGYSANYIKQAVAPQLWRLLSQGLGEKVTKINIRSVLERRMASQNYPKTHNLATRRLTANPDRARAAPEYSFNEQPLPSVEPELPDGSVPLNSPFYVERIPHESRCYEELLKRGALIRIKAPKQMGKTSLMNRILFYGAQQDYKTALLDFQQAEEIVLSDLYKLLRWFCANLTRQLKLEPRLDEYWDDDLGSKMSCTLYVQEYLLEQLKNPLVLALDEVSILFEKPKVAQEFLTLLRAWHEKAKVVSLWQQLRLVMVQSTEVYLPLNINQSPFNVGLGIELEPLTTQQVQDLVQRHRLMFNSKQLAELIGLVAGHPYLVRLTLYHLAREELTLEELMATAATDTGIYSNHLHRHLWNLQQHPKLAAACHQILSTTEPVELEQVQGFKLYSMGLIKLQGNRVTFSCDLYRRYFQEKFLDG